MIISATIEMIDLSTDDYYSKTKQGLYYCRFLEYDVQSNCRQPFLPFLQYDYFSRALDCGNCRHGYRIRRTVRHFYFEGLFRLTQGGLVGVPSSTTMTKASDVSFP
jgi:hypothetical protein